MSTDSFPLPEFRRFDPQCLFAVSPGGGWFANNAALVAGRTGALVVDTFVSESRTTLLLDRVREDVGDQPLSLVLTHPHGDHANGCGIFEQAGAALYASSLTAGEVCDLGVQTYPGVLEEPHWGRLPAPAEITRLSGSTTFDLGGITAEAITMQQTAHTAEDVVVAVPASGLLIAGDLLWNGVTPLALSGSVIGWLDSLADLTELDLETTLPGHGEPADTAGLVKATRDYLLWCLDTAHTGIDSGRDQNDVAAGMRRPDDAVWSGWTCRERDAANIRLAAAEALGDEFDVIAAMQEMTRAIGGLIRSPH